MKKVTKPKNGKPPRVLAAPTGTASEPSVIRIAPGVYEERLYIQREKRFLKLIGLGTSPSEVVLSYHLYAGVLGEDGKKIGKDRCSLRNNGIDFLLGLFLFTQD